MRKIISFLYRNFLKPFLFRRDPERVHEAALALGEKLGKRRAARVLISKLLRYENSVLRQRLLGIDFLNPVGLAAGFDKNGRLTDILPSVGFGFEEIGSITNEPCEGNPKPRLARLPKTRGLVVNYGLPSAGAEKVLKNLSGRKFIPHLSPNTLRKGAGFNFPVGISVAKTNSPKTVPKDAGIADYAECFKRVTESGIGDYIAVNISCPNAYGGEPFTNPADLEDLLKALAKIPNTKPVFLKMPVDLPQKDFYELLLVARRYNIKGVIIANLTKDRTAAGIDREEIKNSLPQGGISGKPNFQKSNELIRFAYQNFRKDLVIIGCGGIFSAEDAYQKIRLGASLVQLITGMIFEGPQLIGEINRGLARLLVRDGFKNIGEAVGKFSKDLTP